MRASECALDGRSYPCVWDVCRYRMRCTWTCVARVRESCGCSNTRLWYDVCVCCLCDCSDGYSDDSESDEEVSVKGFKLHKQKLKWVVRAQVKIFGDRDRKRHLYTLVIKAKGRSR